MTDDSYAAAFVERIQAMDNAGLLRTALQVSAAPDEYHPDAVAALRRELWRRQIGAEEQAEIMDGLRDANVETLRDFAGELAEEGRSVASIEKDLTTGGVDPAFAAEVARSAWDLSPERRKRAGRRNMARGAGLCAAGLMVMAVTWFLSVEKRGHPGFVHPWWVLLVFAGAAQFARGAAQIMRRR